MTQRTIPGYAHLCLAASMVLVGVNVAVGKHVVMEIPVVVFSGLRFVVACAVLAPLTFLEGEGSRCAPTRADWQDLFLQSFFGVFLFTLLMLYGVSMTSASSAGVITGAIPAAIAILAWLLLGERPTTRVSLGVVLAAVGLVALNVGGASSGDNATGGAGGTTATGMLLVGGAVISEALFTIFAKRGSANIPPVRMAFYVNLIGLVLFAPFSIWSGLSFGPAAVSPTTWLLAVYYALTASVISFLLWYVGVKHVAAAQAGVFTAILPVAAVTVSITFLDEAVTAPLIAGVLCVVSAVVLVDAHKAS